MSPFILPLLNDGLISYYFYITIVYAKKWLSIKWGCIFREKIV